MGPVDVFVLGVRGNQSVLGWAPNYFHIWEQPFFVQTPELI